MWKVIQEILPILLIVIFVTQIVYPLLTGGRLFWLFKSNKIKSKSALADELTEAKQFVSKAKEKVDSVREKAKEAFKSAEDIKNDSDSLL